MKSVMKAKFIIRWAILLAPLNALFAAELTVGPGGFKTIGEGVEAWGDIVTKLGHQWRLGRICRNCA